MPAQPIVIGVEFPGPSVGNWDGSMIETWITVNTGTPASPGRFTIRWNNGASTTARLTIERDGAAPVVVNVPPGEGSFDAGNRQWSDWRHVDLVSAPGPGRG